MKLKLAGSTRLNCGCIIIIIITLIVRLMAHYSDGDDGGFASLAALIPSNHKDSSTSQFVIGMLQPKLERNMLSKHATTSESGINHCYYQGNYFRNANDSCVVHNEQKMSLELVTVTNEMNRNRSLGPLTEGLMKMEALFHNVQDNMHELSLLVEKLQATSYNGQFVWKIPEVGRRRDEAISGKTISLYSASFYTNRFGYKLCLRLYMNGDGSGKGTHLSFFLTIMKGEYDALLEWPFNQIVTLMLLDQSSKKKHIVQCFKPESTSSSFWRPQSDMNVASGCPKFASLSVLMDPDFVKDDTIFIKIVWPHHHT